MKTDREIETIWRLSHRAERAACRIADRHYNRQKPGTPQFVPPGRCLVLVNLTGDSLWVTSWPFAEYVKHRWPGAWVCSCYRKEHGGIASEEIRQAIAVTRWKWPAVPELGLVTFIDSEKVPPMMRRGKETWGYSWLKAGFERDGETEGGLLAFRMEPSKMPDARRPAGLTKELAFCDYREHEEGAK